MSETRSHEGEIAQLYLFPAQDDHGVGARQARPRPSAGGGGYQDVCTGHKSGKKTTPRDPRLDELRRMGVQRVWVDIAERIGVDAFLVIWRIMDADPTCSVDGTMLRVPLRPYRAYLRYQRNRYIETLADEGLSPREIKARIEQQLGEKLHITHIRRLATPR